MKYVYFFNYVFTDLLGTVKTEGENIMVLDRQIRELGDLNQIKQSLADHALESAPIGHLKGTRLIIRNVCYLGEKSS